jgi:hypothetical protein
MQAARLTSCCFRSSAIRSIVAAAHCSRSTSIIPPTLLGFLPLRHSEALTVLVHLCSSVASDTFTMAEWRAPGVVLSYALDSAHSLLALSATAYRRPLVWQLRGLVQMPTAIMSSKACRVALLPAHASCDALARDAAVPSSAGAAARRRTANCWCAFSASHASARHRSSAAGRGRPRLKSSVVHSVVDISIARVIIATKARHAVAATQRDRWRRI